MLERNRKKERKMKFARALFVLWGLYSHLCSAQNQRITPPFVGVVTSFQFCATDGTVNNNCANGFHVSDHIRVNVGWFLGSLTGPVNPPPGVCPPFLFPELTCHGDMEFTGDLGNTTIDPLFASALQPGGRLAPGTCNVGVSNSQDFIPAQYVTNYSLPGIYTVHVTLFACQKALSNPNDPGSVVNVPTTVVLATNTLTIAVLPDDADPDFADSVDFGACHQCESAAAAPINVTTGNTYVIGQDLSIPGLGGGLQLQRIWNSLLPYGHVPQVSGMFGDSWRSSVEESMQFLGNSVIRYWRGNGSSSDFTFSSSSGDFQDYVLTKPSDEHASLRFDLDLNVLSLTFNDGTVRTFTPPNNLSSNYLLNSMADRNGNTTTFTYDANSGNMLRVSAPSGAALNFTYGNANFPALTTLVTSPAGNVQYSYDDAGRLIQVTYADQTSTNYTYAGQSLLTRVTDSSGHLIEAHTYDAIRRGLTSTGGSGSDAVQMTYVRGSSQLQTARQSSTSFAYFGLNGRRLLNTVAGPGCASCGAKGVASYAYDAAGNRTSATDALGHVVNFVYDSQGNVLSRSALLGDGAAQTWSYTYNVFNEVTSSTDPLGNTTIFIYDNRGNLISAVSPPPISPPAAH